MGYITGAAGSALGMVLQVLCACVCVWGGAGSILLIPFFLSTTPIVEGPGKKKMLVMGKIGE